MHRNSRIIDLTFGLTAACFAVALLIVAFQAVFWLRFGHWPEITAGTALLWAGLAYPEIPWLGVQKVALWILDQPLSWVLFASGVAGGWVFISLTND